MAGHIKIDRKILNWEWYGDSKMVHLFLHLLIKANYADSRFQGILIKRGQVIVGRLKLAAALGLSERQIRTAIDKLKLTGEIVLEVTNKYSIITICKYDSYQSEKRKVDQQEVIQEVTHNANERPTNDQQPTTSKEELKKKEEVKENNTAAPIIKITSNVAVPFTWGIEVTKFLQNEEWRKNFCAQKNLKDADLFKCMKEFTTKLTLQEDFKDCGGLKKHFVNHYNKYGLVVSKVDILGTKEQPKIKLEGKSWMD